MLAKIVRLPPPYSSFPKTTSEPRQLSREKLEAAWYPFLKKSLRIILLTNRLQICFAYCAITIDRILVLVRIIQVHEIVIDAFCSRNRFDVIDEFGSYLVDKSVITCVGPE